MTFVLAAAAKNTSNAMDSSVNPGVKPHLDVVCGIIKNEFDQYLVALRQAHQDHAGSWEFPGGKLQFNEHPEEALHRELIEEVGIKVLDAQAWLQINHDYPHCHISLYVWKVNAYQGEPVGAEGQYIEWVSLEKLKSLKFPQANSPIIRMLVATE